MKIAGSWLNFMDIYVGIDFQYFTFSLLVYVTTVFEILGKVCILSME